MKLAQTILYVQDVEQAAAFYERIFEPTANALIRNRSVVVSGLKCRAATRPGGACLARLRGRAAATRVLGSPFGDR